MPRPAPSRPGSELFEHPQGLDSVITLRVGHPLTLVEAIVLQQKVLALIARRPDVIVLDVAGLMPIDEMGVLMLPAVARDAAEEGVTVALANPSPPLRDRLAQLGVHNLTFITAPPDSTHRGRKAPPPESTPPPSLPPPPPPAPPLPPPPRAGAMNGTIWATRPDRTRRRL